MGMPKEVRNDKLPANMVSCFTACTAIWWVAAAFGVVLSGHLAHGYYPPVQRFLSNYGLGTLFNITVNATLNSGDQATLLVPMFFEVESLHCDRHNLFVRDHYALHVAHREAHAHLSNLT